MNKLLFVMTLAGFIGSTLVYAYANFATVQYVDTKHSEVKEDLRELKEGQKEIHKMIREMWRETR